ncbi:FTR1 family iron permease [Candidatus Nitrosotenuis uzonensis]|uniref:Iron permease FTR1 (Modular protein) n=1 Tax=Candidatus Nitrosotenuis uzonensis TaxID=1407055 RepID=V6AT31_9ARCH|nr:FTR1 family protein [Candidatus Nitrosotenuis uzonensis]CDI05665.1 Iron permease FTR1 (modular protein) [Candidatus Nitrosotenuis uzonensis]
MISRLALAILFATVLLIDNVYAQDAPLADAAGKVTGIGLDLTKSSIMDGNMHYAKIYSKFTADYYGRQLGQIRNSDFEHVDDLHILILDLHSKIEQDAKRDEILSDIMIAKSYLEKAPVSGQLPLVISIMLSTADEVYQASIENDAYYNLAESLVDKSMNLFSDVDMFDQRQQSEINSFFSDLKAQMSERKDFVSVGKLITTIQRDLTGTDTVSSDSSTLYNTIRYLYEESLAEIKQGNYARAEEYVISAYLDNFEYLEADIESVDTELLHKMEINMREDLRNMVKQKRSYEEIRDFINDPILVDLANAETMVGNLNRQEANMPISAKKEMLPMGSATENEKSGVRGNIDFIRDTLETMLSQYREKNYQTAFTSARTAYLDSYEHVEIPLRAIDPDFTLEVELQFAELRNLINQRAPYEDVQEATVAVRRSLDESERLVTGTGHLAPTIAFTSSFAVVFREGLESVLVLGAILTYLEASRNARFKPYVYYGVILAIGATAVTWLVASYVITISGANRELIEAVAALSATAVLFYVSFWILNKIEHKKWMEFVKAKVWQATTTGGTVVFVMLAFFTVYREGFETVLFYEAMFGFAKYMEFYVGIGFVAGLAVLLGVYYVTRKLGKRLPLKLLFALTMGVGAYLSIAFLGNAVRELQTLDIVPYTGMLGTIPRLDINMAKMTGIYPTRETLIAQIALLGVYLTASLYVLVLRPRKEQKILSMRKSRGKADEFQAY